MQNELEKRLYDKYPEIFIQKNLGPDETCMYWGMEIGDGWYHIIDNLCEKIQYYVNASGIQQIEAVQVKQKFGTLRFYVNISDEFVDDLISSAEEESSQTCEHCGSKEDIGTTKGWIMVLCRKCAKNYINAIWSPIDGKR